jgi:hypothetical protein
VIWTNLPRAFGSQKTPATVDEVLAYLKGLEGETLEKAAEYVRRPPRQIDTACRQAIAATLGWKCESN